MKRVIKYLLISIVALVATGLVVFFFFPGKIVQISNWSFANQANLIKKSMFVDDYEVHYYQSKIMDKEKTLVLLHGMGDDKSSFLQSAKLFSDQYNLILPDLNGHGENAKDKSRDYSIEGQTFFLHNFLESLNITTYYLGGNSMGGHTALAYTLHYPNEIEALILINAPGVTLDDHVVYGGFGKPMNNKEDLMKVLSRVYYKVPDLPGPIANYIIETVNNSLDFVDHTLVPSIVNGGDFDLKDQVQDITAPTLILWGKHDGVVKINVAEYLNKTIPNSSLVFIDDAAHSPQLEVPNKVSEKMIQFLHKIE